MYNGYSYNSYRQSYIILLEDQKLAYICNRNDDTIDQLPGLGRKLDASMKWLGVKSWAQISDYKNMKGYESEGFTMKILEVVNLENRHCEDQPELDKYKKYYIDKYVAEDGDGEKVLLNKMSEIFKQYRKDVSEKCERFVEKIEKRFNELQSQESNDINQIYWFYVLKKFYYDKSFVDLIDGDKWDKYEALKQKRITFDEYVVLVKFDSILRKNYQWGEKNPLTKQQFVKYVIKRNKVL